MNHYNYTRWLILHVDDLLKVEYTCSDIYKKSCNAKLAISKSKTPVLAFVLFLFFSIAIDQAHEQNNTVIKEVVGVVGLLSKNRHAALR